MNHVLAGGLKYGRNHIKLTQKHYHVVLLPDRYFGHIIQHDILYNKGIISLNIT